MDPFTGLAIGGVASSLLGGIFGSNSASKAAAAEQAAAREARQLKVTKDAESQFFADVALYGKSAAMQRFRARYGPEAAKYLGEKAADPTFSDEDRARYDALGRVVDSRGFERTDRPLTQAERARGALPGNSRNANTEAAARAAAVEAARTEREALFRKAGGRIGTTGLFNVDAVQDGPGFIQRMQGFADQRAVDNQSLLADARGIENSLDAYGANEEARINRDSDRALTGANRLARASLMGRGFGAGTAMTGAIERNARSINESRGDQLGRLADNKIRLKAAAKGDTLNLRRGLLDNEYQFRMQPLNTELQYATGAIQNPWQGVNTTQYVSAASPSAAAGATWGNLLSASGGQMANLGMMGIAAQNPNFRSLFGAA